MSQPDRIALQLYTVRELAEADVAGTLGEVARLGYRAVEFAGLHGVSPAAVRAALDDHGLHAVSAHVPFEDWSARADAALDELGTLGCEFAVVPSLPGTHGKADTIAETGALLDEWGAACAAAGLRLTYHNHASELETRSPGGEALLDLLAEATDPSLVGFELDVYWVRAGGANPVDYLDRLAGRVPIIHAKDVAAGGEHAPVGEGLLPWPEVLDAARRAGVEWYVTEQDDPADPLRDSRTSLRNLERLLTDAAVR